MKTHSKFWDSIAEKYAADPVRDTRAYQEKLDKTAALLTPDSEVFEFGCGTGTTALYHAPNVKKVIATDISAKMIDIAKDKAAKADITNVDFQVTEFESYDGPEDSFDMVMAHSILHLVPDRQAAIRRAKALLKPGGYFVSSTVCLDDKMPYIRPVIWGMQLIGKAPQVSFLRGKHLVKDIKAAGFEIEEASAYSKGLVSFVIAKRP